MEDINLRVPFGPDDVDRQPRERLLKLSAQRGDNDPRHEADRESLRPPAELPRSPDADLTRFFDSVGTFDHLVYTAAENLSSLPLAEYRPELGLKPFGLRLIHAFNVIRHAVGHLRTGGSISLTSGTAAWRGGTGWLLGSAVSGAMVSAVRSLSVELAPIRVNAVAPGVVRSPLWGQMSEVDRERIYAETGGSLPLGRVGETDYIAKAFFTLMDQDWATGTVSVVDGGTLVS